MMSSRWVPGAGIGPYRLVRSLGAGGMGEVFLADDERLRRRVAIKRLRADDPAPEATRRILREARAAAALSHPNIATIFDVLDQPDAPCIVMEYAEGGTLADRLSRGPLSVEETRRLGLQVADALAAAHAAGIVHRDLKPGNIALNADGRPKILDFGLAGPSLSRRADAETSTDDTVMTPGAGSPAYMAPERLRGALCDERGDVYALGVTLFEAVTGERAFRADSLPSLAAAILDGPRPEAVAGLSRAAGPRLAAIIERAMAREPAQRFPSARAMADALSTLAPQPRPGRRAALTVGLAALALAGLIGAGLWRMAHPPAGGAPGAREVLVIVPFADDTGGTPEYGGVAASVSQMALAALTHAADFHVVRGRGFDGAPARSLAWEAREQGASLALSGSVQAQAPRRLRVFATLVRPESGVVVWSGQVEGQADDYFALQGPLEQQLRAGLVTAGLPVRSGAVGSGGAGRAETQVQEAYNAYVRGRGRLLRRDVPQNRAAAVAAFEQSIAADPGFARAHAGLAEAAWSQYLATDDQSWVLRAQQAVDEAVRLAPALADVRYVRALILQGRGDLDGAVAELRSLLALEERNDEAHRLLGDILSRRDETAAAIVECRRAIDLRPAFWEHHMTLGLVLFRAGRFAEAASAFRVITELLPDNARGFSLACAALMAGDRLDEAREACARADRLDPGDGDAAANLATILFWQGRYRQSRAEYERAVALRPADGLFHRNLGDTLQQLELREDARSAWREAAARLEADLRVNAGDDARRSHLAVVRAKLQDCAAAEALSREAAQRTPRSAEVRYNAAVVLSLCGRANEAADALEVALSLGYSDVAAKYDPDLEPVRSLARTPGRPRP